MSSERNTAPNPHLYQLFRSTISDLTIGRLNTVRPADDLDLRRLAAAGLNYLRGNPDPARVLGLTL